MKNTFILLAVMISTSAISQVVSAQALIDTTKLSDQELVDIATAGGLGKCMATENADNSVSVGLYTADGHDITQDDVTLAQAAQTLKDYNAAGVCAE